MFSNEVMEKRQRLSCDGASLLCGSSSETKSQTPWEEFSGPRRTVCSEGLVGMGYSEVALTWFFHHI